MHRETQTHRIGRVHDQSLQKRIHARLRDLQSTHTQCRDPDSHSQVEMETGHSLQGFHYFRISYYITQLLQVQLDLFMKYFHCHSYLYITVTVMLYFPLSLYFYRSLYLRLPYCYNCIFSFDDYYYTPHWLLYRSYTKRFSSSLFFSPIHVTKGPVHSYIVYQISLHKY